MRECFIIRRIRKPLPKKINEDLEWFCKSLGLLGRRDKGKTGLKIFRLLILATREESPLSIEEIVKETKLSRTAVVHHLKTMESLGLIVKESGGYYLREANLEELVNELFLDLERTMKSIREIAEDLDKAFKMPVRKK